MWILILICIGLISISIYTEKKTKYKKNVEIEDNNTIKEYEYNNYIKRNYIMTTTELKFYKELKKVTDKNNMTIFAQVNLERIINTKNDEYKYRNKIKSRTIDFVIVSNKNCKIICAIELDDYTHNYKERIERDKFINGLFEKTNLPLLRIKVSNYYNLENIEQSINKYIKNEI